MEEFIYVLSVIVFILFCISTAMCIIEAFKPQIRLATVIVLGIFVLCLVVLSGAIIVHIIELCSTTLGTILWLF